MRYSKRITDGQMYCRDDVWSTRSPSSITSALPLLTSTKARRTGHTLSGSKFWFSTSTWVDTSLLYMTQTGASLVGKHRRTRRIVSSCSGEREAPGGSECQAQDESAATQILSARDFTTAVCSPSRSIVVPLGP